MPRGKGLPVWNVWALGYNRRMEHDAHDQRAPPPRSSASRSDAKIAAIIVGLGSTGLIALAMWGWSSSPGSLTRLQSQWPWLITPTLLGAGLGVFLRSAWLSAAGALAGLAIGFWSNIVWIFLHFHGC